VLKLVARKTADLVTDATLEKLIGIPVHTVTYDNGKEFSDHASISQALGASCYFAKPYHSWERGLNEHTNGLVRQYLPKGTNLRKVSDDIVQAIAYRLNNRPRKSLGYKTPAEVFMAATRANSSTVIRDG
jgi:IS30 family transposase